MLVRLCLNFLQRLLGHAGVMFQRQLCDVVAFIQVAYQSGKTDHGAGLPVVLSAQSFEFSTRIKIVCLYANHAISLR